MLLIGLVAGCGGGQSAPANADPAAGEALPLQAGDRWQFRTSTFAGILVEGEREMRVLSSTPSADGTRLNLTGWRFQSLQDGAVTLLRTTSALIRVPTADDDAVTQAIGPRVLMPLPLQAGDRWTQVDTTVPLPRDNNLDGLPDQLHVVATGTVEAGGPISLPIGDIPSSWKVTVVETQDDLAMPVELQAANRVTVVDILWLAPGLGPVARSTSVLGSTIIRPRVNGDALLARDRPPPA